MRKSLRGMALAALFIVAPLTARAAPDFSDPRKTMLTLQQSAEAHDSKALRSCFDTSAPNKTTQTYLDAWDASLRFQDAMEKKFGHSGIEAAQSVKPAAPFADLQTKWEEAGTLSMNGDTALLTPDATPNANPPINRAPIHFKRIDGQWKIDASNFLSNDDSKAANQLKLMAQITDALNGVTDEINSGKILAAQQAQQALVQKIIPLVHPPEKTASSSGSSSPPSTNAK